MDAQRIVTVDYHTAGEPFRIPVEGIPPLEGSTILAKRRFAADNLDDIRRLLVFEPRGHADMYGGFVTAPEDEDADLGVVFFHNAGYSTACGHGTIALVTWALDEGHVARAGPETKVVVDVPSGRLETIARLDGERVASVTFRNVPSFVFEKDVKIETSAGPVVADISFGGAFYANVDASSVGRRVAPEHLNDLIALGREIKHAIEARMDVVHPVEAELRDVYGVIFFEADDAPGHLAQRNVTIFADGEVDRSPCGSGTSARLALLDASGELARGETLLHRSIIGTEFRARVTADSAVAEYPAVVTEVEGSAHRTGRHEFTIEPDDPVGLGFLLR